MLDKTWKVWFMNCANLNIKYIVDGAPKSRLAGNLLKAKKI